MLACSLVNENYLPANLSSFLKPVFMFIFVLSFILIEAVFIKMVCFCVVLYSAHTRVTGTVSLQIENWNRETNM